MGWIYYEIQQKEKAFNESLELFLNECLINKELVNSKLVPDNCYRFIIRTDGENDKILVDGYCYLKSRFLKNKFFKQRLVDYYKPLGVYVSGPKEIIRKDGTQMNKWLIELYINGKYNIN